MAPARQHQQRRGVPEELVKDFDIELIKDEKTVKTVKIRNNHQRLCVCDFDSVLCDGFKISIISTNGSRTVTVFEIRSY